MKTIFVSIFDGDTERVILRTSVFDVLKASGNRIVLLVRGKDRISHYEKEYKSDQVYIELLPEANSWQEHVWYYVGWNSIPTRSSEVRRIREYWNKGKYVFFILGSIAGILAKAKMWREFLRYLYLKTGEDYVPELFEKYKPDLLFAANMFSPEDTRLLRAAKIRNVRNITMAKSWDVLTTKAFTRVKGDFIIVYNEPNKKEAIEIGDYTQEQVIVTGFPQFDIYYKNAILSRDEFCKRVGLDPQKEYALYGIPGDWKSPDTRHILSVLDKKITEGAFIKPFQILARFHPKYRDSSEGLDTKHIIFDKPGVYFNTNIEFGIDSGSNNMNHWTFRENDIVHLMNSLRHASMVINVDSTLTLDGVANNKPVIIIAYDGGRKLSYKKSIAFIYERDHYQRVIKTGGVSLVKSHAELTDTINRFLENPESLREERERLKEEILYKLDGRGGERMGQAVLSALL